MSGDEIAFDADYTAYQEDCGRRYTLWWRGLAPFGLIAQVPPGLPVENEQMVIAVAVAQAIRAGDPSALAMLQAATARYGSAIVATIARLPQVVTGARVGVLQGQRDT